MGIGWYGNVIAWTGRCVFVKVDLGLWYESSGVLQGLLVQWVGFLLFHKTQFNPSLWWLSCKANRIMSLFLSVCVCTTFFSNEEETLAGLWHDTSVTQITSTALVACKDDIPVGILNACVLVYVFVCVCVHVFGLKAFLCIWMMMSLLASVVPAWQTGTVGPVAANVCG